MHLASKDQRTLVGDRRTPYASQNTLLTTPTPTPSIPPSWPHRIQARATPTPTCCMPNQVLIELSTTVVIQDFQRFYSSDINSFTPTYFPTADGSLITPALTNDLWAANVDLLVTAALAMLFLRNIAVAIDYLRRGKNKDKTLFYLVFASQTLAPATFVPLLLSFFNQYVNCTLVVTMSSTVGSVALAILLSGIIGIKTYRCMNDSKIIAVVIIALALGHLAFVVLDAIAMRGVRRIAGSCLRISDLRYTRIVVALQLGQCCFMMLCFVYTCIKYRKTPGARGRISLRLSVNELAPEGTDQEVVLGANQLGANEKADLSTKVPDYVPPRSPVLRISSELPLTHPEDGRSHARKSMASSFSRLSRLLSNMVSLKKVMRDELLYTCVITFVITFALVFTFTGVNIKNSLSVTSWISLTWALVSILVLHSSGRVVRRQERDFYVRYATTRISQTSFSTPKFARANDFCMSIQAPNTRIQRYSHSKHTGDSDQFSETYHLRQDRQPFDQLSGSTSPQSPLSMEVAVSSHNNSGGLPLLSAQESSFPTSDRASPDITRDARDHTSRWHMGLERSS